MWLPSNIQDQIHYTQFSHNYCKYIKIEIHLHPDRTHQFLFTYTHHVDPNSHFPTSLNVETRFALDLVPTKEITKTTQRCEGTTMDNEMHASLFANTVVQLEPHREGEYI